MNSSTRDKILAQSPEEKALIITGSIQSADVPIFLNYMSYLGSPMFKKIILTESACHFVSQTVLQTRFKTEVFIDTWDYDQSHALNHVTLFNNIHQVIVYPATFNYLSRIAHAAADTPTQLALVTQDSIEKVFCPAIPPQAIDSQAYKKITATVAEIPNSLIIPPLQARSALSDGKSYVAPPLEDVIFQAQEYFHAEIQAPR